MTEKSESSFEFRKLIFLRDIQYLIQAGFLTSELCILIFILLTRYDSRDTRYEFHYTLNAVRYTIVLFTDDYSLITLDRRDACPRIILLKLGN